MRDDQEDEFASEKYREKVEAVVELFRRAPHNLIEEIEKLGFTYVVDDNEGAEQIAEERIACPATIAQSTMVSYLEGTDLPTESLLTLWCDEIQRADTPLALWRRYFRAGNAQLKRLILFGLSQSPTDRGLLDALSFLHFFQPMPRELLARYTLACGLESDPQRFRELAWDFDANACSFGFDALQALQQCCADNAVKKPVVDGLLAERGR
jgi:hypothetical protein